MHSWMNTKEYKKTPQYPLSVITKIIIKMILKIVSPPLTPESDQIITNSTNTNNPTQVVTGD